MKPKMAVSIFLILVIIGYFIALKSNAYIFIIFFPLAPFASILNIILLAADLIWKFSPSSINRTYETRKMRFKTIILACLMFFIIGGWAINRFFLPGTFHPLGLVWNLALLLFTLFLGWGLLKSKKKIVLFVGVAGFIGIIFLLAALNSITLMHTQQSSTEALKSLPYVKWVPAAEAQQKSGVTRYDREKSFEGINLYCLRNFSEAYLADMYGNILHTWSDKKSKKADWVHVELCRNGDLLAIVYMGMLTRLDWDSRIKWTKKMHFHHEITVAENGDIYALASKADIVFFFGLPVPILNDYVVILFPDGELKKEISLFSVLKEEIPFNKVYRIYRTIIHPKNLWYAIKPKAKRGLDFSSKALFDIFFTNTHFDILHNNTITLIDRNINGLCEKGDILISVREIDLIGIVNLKKEKLLWSWGPGNLSKQHHPTLLENGNILIFDNGCKSGYSRLVELDPLIKEIVWEYKASPPHQFYSEIGGGCRQLPNGNTLITEEYKGRVFEITRNGEIVWEFYSPLNPEIEKDGIKRAAIYRMKRITDPEDYSKLKELEKGNHLSLIKRN